jgi:H+/gluconate symporter-like permease
MLSGFNIGLPVFFQVGLVLLAPVLFTAQRQSRRTAALARPADGRWTVSAHGLVPPHPGPIAADRTARRRSGSHLFYSLILGLPLSSSRARWFTRFMRTKVAQNGEHREQFAKVVGPVADADIGAHACCTMLMPVLLMLIASAAQIAMADGAADARLRSSGVRWLR